MNENISTNQEIRKTYFITSENEVVYPAGAWRRIGARLMDIILISIIPFIIVLIYSLAGWDGDSSTAPKMYDFWVVGMASLQVVLAIVFFIVIPMLNKKYFGQSLGKKVFNLSPMYFGKNKYMSFLKRETIITGLYLIPTFMIIISGYDITTIYSGYINYAVDNELAIEFTNIHSFIYDGWNTLVDSNIYLTEKINSFQQGLLYASTILQYFVFFALIFISISVGIEFQKRGFHDKIANTAVIDLKTFASLDKVTKEYDMILNTNSEEKNIEPEVVEDKGEDNLIQLVGEENIISELNKYNNMTIAQLKEELTKREIEFKSNLRKSELIELLEKNDLENGQ